MKLSILILALVANGCAATYTSIRKQDDGTYLVTRVKGGFMGSTRGSLFQCVAAPAGMRCVEVDSP